MLHDFQKILRSKTAEQLLNMHQNKDAWSEDEMRLIYAEIKNRDLEIFEEVSEWNEEEMNEIDLLNPQSNFEKDLAFIQSLNKKESDQSGIYLAAQIVSISSVLAVAAVFVFFRGATNMSLLMLQFGLAFGSLILFLVKQHLFAIIVGGVSLIVTLSALYQLLT